VSGSQREQGVGRDFDAPPIPPPAVSAQPAHPSASPWESLSAPHRDGAPTTPESQLERPKLTHSSTSITTPDIGIEPPVSHSRLYSNSFDKILIPVQSQSNTSAEDMALSENPIFLSPNSAPAMISTPQHHHVAPNDDDDEFPDRNHYVNPHSRPPSTQPRAPSTQPIYGRPQFDFADTHNTNPVERVPSYFAHPGWPYQDPKKQGGYDFHGQPFMSSTPPSAGSHDGMFYDEKTHEWVPPPPVHLSPIPAITNLDFNPKKVGGFTSPAPLNRPISLFNDSD